MMIFRQRCETHSLFRLWLPASWAFPIKTCWQEKCWSSSWHEVTASFSAFILGDVDFIRKESISSRNQSSFFRWMSPVVRSSCDFWRLHCGSPDWIWNKSSPHPPKSPRVGDWVRASIFILQFQWSWPPLPVLSPSRAIYNSPGHLEYDRWLSKPSQVFPIHTARDIQGGAWDPCIDSCEW